MKYLNRRLFSAILMTAAAEAAPAGGAPAAPEAPAAKPLTAAQQKKADEKAKKEAEKAEKAKQKAEADAAKPAKVETLKQNGVSRPSSGKTKQVWDTADMMSKELKAPVGRKALTEKLLADGLVVGTIHTQYGKWRKFHGLAKEAAPAKEAPAAAPEAPAAE